MAAKLGNGSEPDGGAITALPRLSGPRLVRGPGSSPLPPRGTPLATDMLPRMVPEVRFELTRPCGHRCLRPTRLPIPPLRPSRGVIIGSRCRTPTRAARPRGQAPADEPAVVAAAVGGDRTAFAQLMEHYQGACYGLASRPRESRPRGGCDPGRVHPCLRPPGLVPGRRAPVGSSGSRPTRRTTSFVALNGGRRPRCRTQMRGSRTSRTSWRSTPWPSPPARSCTAPGRCAAPPARGPADRGRAV